MTLWICMDLYLTLSDLFLLYTFIKFVSLWLDRLRSPSWYWTVEHSGPMIENSEVKFSVGGMNIPTFFPIIFPWNDFFPHHFPWKKTRLCWVFRVTPSLLVHWPGRPGVGGQISWWCCLGFTLWFCQNSYWKWPIEIVNFPMNSMVNLSIVFCKRLPGRVPWFNIANSAKCYFWLVTLTAIETTILNIFRTKWGDSSLHFVWWEGNHQFPSANQPR